MALIVVMWVLVILSVIAGQFCVSMRRQVEAARMIKEDSQAYYIAKAGIGDALERLSSGRIGGGETKETSWRVNTKPVPQAFGDGYYEVTINNESGKVNLNYAGADILKMLFASIGVDDQEIASLVDAVLDWRDADGLRRLNGAENNYYQTLEKPYKCRDGFFRYPDELLLVKGVTKELYLKKGLKNYISTLVLPDGLPTQKQAHQRNRLNINAVSETLLSQLPGMTQEAVQNVVAYRATKDIANWQNFAGLVGVDTANGLKNFIDYAYNRFYTFGAEAWVSDREISHRIEVLVREEPVTEKKYSIVQWKDSVLAND